MWWARTVKWAQRCPLMTQVNCPVSYSTGRNVAGTLLSQSSCKVHWLHLVQTSTRQSTVDQFPLCNQTWHDAYIRPGLSSVHSKAIKFKLNKFVYVYFSELNWNYINSKTSSLKSVYIYLCLVNYTKTISIARHLHIYLYV